MTQRQLVLRPPRPMRIYTVVFMVVWCGFILAFFVRAVAAGSAAALVSLGMLGLGAAMGYRMFNLAVIATPDELIIRNQLSTRRIAKGQVDGFRIGPPSMGSLGKAVTVLIEEDTIVSLDATAQPVRWFGGQRKLDKALADLRSWQTG